MKRAPDSDPPGNPSLGAKIDHRWGFGSRRREAPSEFGEFVCAVFEPPDHGGCIGWPNIVARLEVRDRDRPLDRNTGLAERRQIVGVIDVISVVVAHAGLTEAGYLPHQRYQLIELHAQWSGRQ